MHRKERGRGKIYPIFPHDCNWKVRGKVRGMVRGMVRGEILGGTEEEKGFGRG